MRRITAALALAVFLVGCERNPVDRLLGIEDNHQENAVTPAAPEPAAPQPAAPSPNQTLPRYETFRFEGVVKSGGTNYYGTIAEGQPVVGTFRVDFEAPVLHNTDSMTVYQALAEISGNVGGYSFQGADNPIYVRSNSVTPYWADTGIMMLDGQGINFDFFFVLPDGGLPDTALDHLRTLEGRSYANIDMWFETYPMGGQGFNCKINSIQKVDAPPSVT